MVVSVRFNELYERLNARQREAVDAIEGPVMVVAGPGTGKTQILTLRIANILRLTDTPPEAILALTFTNAGVYAMRERLRGIIGTVSYRVRIHTFHSFCNETIERYPEYFPRIIGGKHASEAARYALVEKLLDTDAYEKIRPSGDPYHYVSAIISAIGELKREHFDTERFASALSAREAQLESDPDAYHKKGRWVGQMKGAHRDKRRVHEKNKELCALYRAYEEALREEKLYDFDDMIGEVVREMERNEDLRLILQEEHQYILADEHQDANDSQNRILDLLSDFHETPNLFVVGDTKQAIYRFQGASRKNFLRFTDRYAEARVVTLEDNYRSHQGVLDAAYALIPEDPLTARACGEAARLTFSAHPTKESEYDFLAAHIAMRIERGVSPSEIAVIYRTNAEATGIARALGRKGIRTVVESSEDILANPAIRLLVRILELAVDLGKDELLAEVLCAPFLPISAARSAELVRRAAESRTSLHRVVESEEPSLYALFVRWKAVAWTQSALDAFSLIFSESGFERWALGEATARDLIEGAACIFGVIRETLVHAPKATLREALVLLDRARAYRLIAKRYEGDLSSRVRLMTAHRAKGREFDFVYIAHVTERAWSGSSAKKKFHLPIYDSMGDDDESAEDDERRLLFVAISRARYDLVISYAEKRDDGAPELPAAIVEPLLAWCDPPVLLVDEPDPLAALRPSIPSGPSLSDREYISELFRRRGLSATALNNYLACPWKYYFVSLLRMPEAKSAAANYGTAVHAALKDQFDALTKGSRPEKADLLVSFARHLDRQPMVAPDFDAFLEKGNNALGGYWDVYGGNPRRNVLTEYRISGYELRDGIALNGSIDKIELGTGRGVTVVDYKTRAPLSRNEIEGLTKDGTGDMKRQLVFYKLLLEGHAAERFFMEAGEIDFIEPTDSGKYKKESFVIADDEVRDLKEEIFRVVTEITTLAFWNGVCRDKDCAYCQLGAMLRAKSVQH